MVTSVPLISVILPVHNGERFLKEAIESILNQTFGDFEFIIVNDGSTDHTEKIILSYSDQRIVYIKNDTNLKLIKSLNKGIDLAKGKYIARMDADDIAFQERFEKQVQVFKSFNGVDMVNCNCFLLEESAEHYWSNKATIAVSFDALIHISMFQNLISHPGLMIKSELMKQYKYADNVAAEHIEDFELWNRLLGDGCICYTIKKPLFFYRVNTKSINNTESVKQNMRINALSASLLKSRFGIEFDRDTLQLLLGPQNYCNYAFLKKLDTSVTSFCDEVMRQYPLTKEGSEDLLFWKKHRIFTTCVLSLSKVNLSRKIQIIAFLISRVFWVLDHKWRVKLIEVVLSKKLKVDSLSLFI